MRHRPKAPAHYHAAPYIERVLSDVPIVPNATTGRWRHGLDLSVPLRQSGSVTRFMVRDDEVFRIRGQ